MVSGENFLQKSYISGDMKDLWVFLVEGVKRFQEGNSMCTVQRS